jgi:hypothetical protein
LVAKDEQAMKGLKDSLTKVVDTVQSEQLARDLLDEKKTKEFKLAENNIMIDLNIEKQLRRESEAKMSKLLDERLYTIRLDLAKEKKIREDTQEHNYSQFGESIRALQEEIEQQVINAEGHS